MQPDDVTVTTLAEAFVAAEAPSLRGDRLFDSMIGAVMMTLLDDDTDPTSAILRIGRSHSFQFKAGAGERLAQAHANARPWRSASA